MFANFPVKEFHSEHSSVFWRFRQIWTHSCFLEISLVDNEASPLHSLGETQFSQVSIFWNLVII